jgi:hypothetical protein
LQGLLVIRYDDGVLGKALDFFLSLRTAIWLLLALIVLFLFGALVMPVREEFQGINALPLFLWLRESPPGASWWLLGSIAALSLLTANTLLCSIESIIRKRRSSQWLLIISPQVIHIGFLFMLLAHLVSSTGSFKGRAAVQEGAGVMLPGEVVLRVKAIEVLTGPGGFPTDWRAEVEYLSGDRRLREDYIGPNRPSFYRGLGVYIKDIRPGAALIEVSREPGAPWSLAGGVLFMAGTLALFFLKIRKEL